MYRLTVLYGQPTDPDAFDKHYAEVHGPLASKIPGLVAYQGGKAQSLNKSEPPYYYVATLDWATAEDFQAGMSSPEMGAAGADVANFATGGATMFSEELTDFVSS